MIDLHIHTTASDGRLSPAEIAAIAEEKEMTAVAITDHDSISGNNEAINAAAGLNVEVVPGVELSVNYRSTHFHLLGYYIDLKHPGLLEAIERVQTARAKRNPQIIERLQQIGMDITMDEVTEEAGGGQIGRPHIAAVLLRKGYIKEFQQAFDTFLATGQPAYVDKYRLPAEESIQLILDAGGIPVIAHPGLLDQCLLDNISGFFDEMKTAGVRGVEVYYPRHTKPFTSKIRKLIAEKGLIETGGTDFHEPGKGLHIGNGFGKLTVPDSCLTMLKEARDGMNRTAQAV